MHKIVFLDTADGSVCEQSLLAFKCGVGRIWGAIGMVFAVVYPGNSGHMGIWRYMAWRRQLTMMRLILDFSSGFYFWAD